PGGGRPIKDVYLYGALQQQSDGWTGNFMSASVAPTPVPIPITLNGTFRLYRLDSVQPRGGFDRLFDVVSGCGRPAYDGGSGAAPASRSRSSFSAHGALIAYSSMATPR